MGVIADKIRKAILGGEVRDNIAEGIEVVEQLREDYDRQVINAGNSNAEIVDARGNYTKLKERLDKEHEEVSAQLDNITQESIPKLEDEMKNKIFKPKFSVSCYWGEVSDTAGGSYTSTIEKIQTDIKKWVSHGFESVILIFHIGYNSINNQIFLAEDLNQMYLGAMECLKNGIKINAIKVHLMKCEDSDIEKMEMENFKTQYQNIITSILNRFSSIDCNYFIPFNEIPYLYTTNASDYCCQVLTMCKSYGYKVGVSCKGPEDGFNIPNEVVLASDVVCINFYKAISHKGKNTTLMDSFNSWYGSGLLSWVRYFKNKYNKPVIISETGVKDYWDALIKPETSFDDVNQNGVVQNIYWTGALEYLNDEDIDSVWMWFGVVSDTDETVSTFRYYLRGEANEF